MPPEQVYKFLLILIKANYVPTLKTVLKEIILLDGTYF